MAIAAANLAVVAAQITGRRRFGLMAAALLVLSHTGWWLSTVAEVYTWSLAGFTAELWLLLSLLRRATWRKLAALALVNGLGLAVHNFALLPLPVYVLTALLLIRSGRLRAWALAAAAGAWLAGASLYIGLIVRDIAGGNAVLDTIRSALVGEFTQNVLNAGLAWNTVRKVNLILMLMNVIGPPLLAFVGAARLGASRLSRFKAAPSPMTGAGASSRSVAAAFGAIALIHLLFVARYNVPDQFTFFLPAMAMIYLYAAVGLAVWSSRSRTSRRVAWAMMLLWLPALPLLYSAVPAVARKLGGSGLEKRELPFRDELRYWLAPWKQDETSAQQFALAALSDVAPRAVVYADPTSFYPLAVARETLRLRPDVLLAGEDGESALPRPEPNVQAFLAALGDRPLYVVTPTAPYLPQPLMDALDFEKAGVLYKAAPKDGQTR
jgi:hypothetical protein